MNASTSNPFSTEAFVAALTSPAARLSDTDRAMLLAHYHAPDHLITATELAHAVGFATFDASNLHYSKVATKLSRLFNHDFPRGSRFHLLVSMHRPGTYGNEHWLWRMRPELARALERLGWVGAGEAVLPSPDFETPPERVATQVNRIIRDTPAAKALKIDYQFHCQVCGLQICATPSRYYIEVHHIRPLGGGHHGSDDRSNMLVLCPNHHAMFDLWIPRFVSPSRVSIASEEFELTMRHTLSAEVLAYYASTQKPETLTHAMQLTGSARPASTGRAGLRL